MIPFNSKIQALRFFIQFLTQRSSVCYLVKNKRIGFNFQERKYLRYF